MVVCSDGGGGGGRRKHTDEARPSPPTQGADDDTWGAWVPYPVGHRKRLSFLRHYEEMLRAREASRRRRYAPAVQAVLDGEAFGALRRRRTVLEFDPVVHRLVEAFLGLVDVASLAGEGAVDLAKLHERWDGFDRGCSHLADKASFLAPLAVPSDARDAFANAYDALFRDVVAPGIAAAMPGERRLLYAAFPCVRIQQPCDFHTIRCHVDSMYGHPSGSLNVWLPLTQTAGSNTLHLESAPGAEDFKPLEMKYGELVIFDGTTCAHYTLANTTDDTRVSLDFRVIPGSVFDPEAECSRVKGGAQSYNLGGYYSEARLVVDESCAGIGRWVRTVAGRPSIKHGFPHRNAEFD